MKRVTHEVKEAGFLSGYLHSIAQTPNNLFLNVVLAVMLPRKKGGGSGKSAGPCIGGAKGDIVDDIIGDFSAVVDGVRNVSVCILRALKYIKIMMSLCLTTPGP